MTISLLLPSSAVKNVGALQSPHPAWQPPRHTAWCCSRDGSHCCRACCCCGPDKASGHVADDDERAVEHGRAGRPPCGRPRHTLSLPHAHRAAAGRRPLSWQRRRRRGAPPQVRSPSLQSGGFVGPQGFDGTQGTSVIMRSLGESACASVRWNVLSSRS